MERKKVVCFVNHTAETGGAEFALVRLVSALDRKIWHPVVVFGEDGPAVELVRAHSVECYVLPMAKELSSARRESLRGVRPGQLVSALSYVWKLRTFFRQRAVEVVHTNSMKAHVLGGFAAWVSGLPLLWHLRDSLHPSCLPFLALTVMRFLARNLPDKLVTVSKSVAIDALGSRRASAACVVYDGLDDRCFVAPRQPLSGPQPAQGWTVGIAGRLCAWKGQHLFLQAAVKLVQRGVPVRFEILGGPLFGQEAYALELEKIVAESGLQSAVKFCGFVHNVPERIRTWDVLVHASTSPDPCPNVVLEAMAAGVPVVGAAGGGVPEILADGACGVLFKPEDPEALSSGIEDLLRKPGKRREIAVAALERARLLFRSERVAREVEAQWNKLFDETIYKNRAWRWIEEDFSSGKMPRAQNATT